MVGGAGLRPTGSRGGRVRVGGVGGCAELDARWDEVAHNDAGWGEIGLGEASP
jgi:hypothetical protein